MRDNIGEHSEIHRVGAIANAKRFDRNINRIDKHSQNMNKSARIGFAIEGKYRYRVIDTDGKKLPWSEYQKNLVLDSGLDYIGTHRFIYQVYDYLQWGTGSAPVRRDSSPITFSQVGNQVTASAPFFSAGDVGALLKYGTGSAGAEKYILGVTSNVLATVSDAIAAGPVVGTIWFVAQTALDTYAGESNSIQSQSTTFTNPSGTGVFTSKMDILSAAFGAAITVTELGWNHTGQADPLYSRVLLPGGGQFVNVGQKIEVEYDQIMSCTPGTPTAVGDTSGGIWDTAGTACWQGGLAIQNLSGTGQNILDPGHTPDCEAAVATWAQQDMNVTDLTNVPTRIVEASHAQAAYVNGHFYVSSTHFFDVSTANGTWYGVFWCGNGYYLSQNFSIKFTTPIVKDNTFTLTFTLVRSWGRQLTN